MLLVNYIRENKELVVERLKIKNFKSTEVLQKIIEIDADRRSTQGELDQNLSEANSIAKNIGELFKNGNREEAEDLKKRSSELKEINKTLGDSLHSHEKSLKELLYQVPNIPNALVPAGNSDADNEIIHEEGTIPENVGQLPHWDIVAKYDTIDFELGNKITGAGFPVYKGKGAKLQRALINFFLEEAIAAGYHEVMPPLVVNEDSGFGTGQLPDKEGQMYHLEVDNLYLIPTAEVPITNMYRNTIVKESDFPIKNCGYTPCFRREAGSYGKDVRGLNRLHQFDKVEVVQIAHPDASYAVLDEMVAYVKSLLRKLELPFRVTKLCGGDLSFASALTYDMEVYSSAQDKWLEVSSISNFESFQSNRLKLRFKGADGKTQLAHTLNGSALALPRIVAALIENNQTEQGVKIPEALVPYTGFEYLN